MRYRGVQESRRWNFPAWPPRDFSGCLLYTAMFEIDHSAARGKMAVRELIVFKHSKEFGDCPAYRLFDAVEVKKHQEVIYPRKYQDYQVEIHADMIPETVEISRKI